MVFTSFSQYPKIYTNSTTQHQMRIIFLRPSQTLQIPRFWSLLAFASDARGCSRDAHLCQISALVQARRVFYRKDQIAFNRVFESLHITSRRYSKVTFRPVPEFHREAQQESRGCAGNFPRRESVKIAWWNLLIGIRAVTKHRVRSIINGVDV